MITPKQTLPLARTKNLVVQEVANESLVYDESSHEAHCLNRTAALVWRHCDGRTTVGEMVAILHRSLGTPTDPGVVELALQQLQAVGLVDGHVVAGAPSVSRRRVLSRLGTAGMAMALAPLVTSVMTRTARAQASPKSTTTPTPTTQPPPKGPA